MKQNILYLKKMGSNVDRCTADIKNCRVRVLENIPIYYNGETFKMFFEFTSGVHWHFRKENLRNGKPLKKPVYTIDVENGLYLDTQFERFGNGFEHSFRHSKLEREFWREHMIYNRANVLEVVNRYKIGAKYTQVVFIDQAAADIISACGGYREKAILNGDCVFSNTETWNDDHKVVRCLDRVSGYACEVDLVLGKITN